MKRLILLASLISLVHKSDAMDIPRFTLPSQQELDSRLRSLGLDDFANKSDICQSLGGAEKTPLMFLVSLENALRNYVQLDSNPRLGEQMQLFKPIILKEFLKEHPQAIEFLKTSLTR